MKIMPKLSLPFSDDTRMIVRLAIGLATGLVGLADMLSAVVPKLNWDIPLGVWPIVAYHGAQKLTVVVGLFLVMLSYGLIRGKYQAWNITLGLLILSFFLHILRRGSVLATLTALALTIVLSLLFSYFQARSDPPSVKRGYIVLVLGLGIVVFYTLTGFVVHVLASVNSSCDYSQTRTYKYHMLRKHFSLNVRCPCSVLVPCFMG